MASGRMHFPGEIHMVTNRCEEGRFFLTPTKEAVDIVKYWFARAMKKYGAGLEVYAFCFLCNHFHMLCKDNRGTLAKFMGYFQGNAAKALNLHLGRGTAHFWQGHYDDQIIEGERSFWKKYLYVVTNAVKSRLVNRTMDWQGFCSFNASLSGEAIVASGLNRTRFHNANRGKKKRREKDFIESYEFNIAVLPGMEEMTPKERAKEIRRMVAGAEVHYKARRNNKPPLGMSKVLSISPLHRPETLARSPRRRFACDTKQREHERLDAYRTFVHEYKRTFSGFRTASHLGRPFYGEWPKGSFPPACDQPSMAGWDT